MAITRERVWEVVEAIVAGGKEPTYLLVRERLGTGSFGTIAKFLREWRAERRDGQGQSVQGSSAPMPAPFQEAVLRLGAEAWRAALSAMQSEMVALRESNQRRVEELVGDCEQAARTVDALQEQMQTLRTERDQFRAEREASVQERKYLAERLLVADGTIAALREQVERADAKAGALQQRNEELMRQLAEAEVQVAQQAQRRDEADSRTTTLQGALEQALEQHEALRKESYQTQRELAAA
jgi:chromosome segregation ATPase